MEARWFLGLDGGATKTHCVLYDRQTDQLTAVCAGPSNHQVLPQGMEDLPGVLSGIILPLLDKAGITPRDISSAAFGMCGVDIPLQHQIISEIISAFGFSKFVLSNDAYLGIKAECGSFGISAVNGTGYSVAGIAPDGQMLQIGGHDDMSGDRGGGGYLVPATIRAAYTALFKFGMETSLVDKLYQWLKIDNRDAFCQAVALRVLGDKTTSYREISQILYAAAAEGDAVARKILTVCGEDYALSIRSVAESLNLPRPTPVVLVGSQFTKCVCRHAIDVLTQSLQAEGQWDIRVISTSPVAGALFWAMELAGCAPDGNTRQQLRIRLQDPGRLAV